MKNAIKIFFIISTVIIQCYSSVDTIDDASNTCSRTGNGVITNSTPCYTTPINQTIKFYKVLLCTDQPNLNAGSNSVDLSKCDGVLFDNDNGKIITIEKDVKVGLSDSKIKAATFENTSYPYIVAIIGSTIGLKDSKQFSQSMIGATGNGNYCWTKDIDLSEKTIYYNNWGVDSNKLNWGVECGPTQGTIGTLNMLINDDNGIVSTDPIRGFSRFQFISTNDNLLTSTNSVNNTKLVASFKLASPVKISQSTNSINLNVKITHGDSILMNGGYISAFKVAPFDFDVVVK